MKIGAEFEFWNSRGLPTNIKRKYNIISEYYGGMFEINNFLSEFHNSSGIHSLLTQVSDVAKKIAEEDDNTVIQTAGITVDDYNMVFNGTHIHISLSNTVETYSFFMWLLDSNIVPQWKLSNMPSIRSFWSHHIWGNYRAYNYNYKSKTKFKPVTFCDDLSTVEFRIFDNEDILIESRRKKLATFLWKLVEDFRNKVEIEPYTLGRELLSSGTDLKILQNFCKNTFTKGKNKFRYNSKLNKLTCPSGQVLVINDNYILNVRGIV